MKSSRTPVLVITTLCLALSSCGNHDPQPTLKAFEGHAARLPPEGTISFAEKNPPLDRRGYPEGMVIGEKFLEEGEILFQRNCVVCHGYDGDGKSIAVQRGLHAPPSFHEKTLKESAPAYFVDVMTNGKGRMPAYARRLLLKERWKVAAYVKALQLSRDIPVKVLKDNDRERLP